MTNQVNHQFKAMGGEFQITCFPQKYHSRKQVRDYFNHAQKIVTSIEDKFTDFRNSPFNLINQMAGIRPVSVDNEIFDLIEKSISISKMTKGIFDISFASVGHLWREAKKNGIDLDENLIQNRLKYIDYKKIVLNKRKSTIYLPHSKMKISMGGIGKGYAVDQVADYFIDVGLENFYINGSGDIRVHSAKDAPRRWRIGIRNPFSKSNTIGLLQIKVGAVATSGNYVNYNQTIDNHHILFPKSGRSKKEIISATVYSTTTIDSDTQATYLMNLSSAQALKYMNKNKIFGLIIDNRGISHLSNRALNNFKL